MERYVSYPTIRHFKSFAIRVLHVGQKKDCRKCDLRGVSRQKMSAPRQCALIFSSAEVSVEKLQMIIVFLHKLEVTK